VAEDENGAAADDLTRLLACPRPGLEPRTQKRVDSLVASKRTRQRRVDSRCSQPKQRNPNDELYTRCSMTTDAPRRRTRPV
jgi:hypothetical protein